jgi:Phage integrase family.
MRMKDYDERSGKRVWLSEKELQLIISKTKTGHAEQQIALLLAARCGLRRQEIVDVRPTDLVNTDTGQIVRVWHGKGDKYREVPAPPQLTQLVLGLGRDPDESLVSVHNSTVYDWVERVCARCYSETGDQGWQEVGPHDLRRSWGVRLLEQGVLPSVVMEYGGWEDWETFRNHYLAEFSPEALRRERKKISWLREGSASDEDRENYSVVQTQRY